MCKINILCAILICLMAGDSMASDSTSITPPTHVTPGTPFTMTAAMTSRINNATGPCAGTGERLSNQQSFININGNKSLYIPEANGTSLMVPYSGNYSITVSATVCKNESANFNVTVYVYKNPLANDTSGNPRYLGVTPLFSSTISLSGPSGWSYNNSASPTTTSQQTLLAGDTVWMALDSSGRDAVFGQAQLT